MHKHNRKITTDGGALFASGFPTDQDRRWLQQLVGAGGAENHESLATRRKP